MIHTYEQCPKNSFKRLYTLKGLLVLVEKASFSEEFRSEFHSGGGGQPPPPGGNSLNGSQIKHSEEEDPP